MAEVATKKVVLSQIVEDLKAGLTRWKKDDIGFGSLEKKYNLQIPEMVELLAHPKIKNVETKIPTFIIVDDLMEEPIEELKSSLSTTIHVGEVEIVKQESSINTTVYVKQEPVREKRKTETFI